MRQKILMLLVMVGVAFPLSMNARDTIPHWMYICSQGRCIPQKISEISKIYRTHNSYDGSGQMFVDTKNVETHYYVSKIDSVVFVEQGPTFSQGLGYIRKIGSYSSRYGETLYGYALEFYFKLNHISAHVKKVRCFIDADTTFNNAIVKEMVTDISLGSGQTIVVNLRENYDETISPYKDYPYLNIYRPVYVYMEYCYEMDGVSSVVRTPVRALVIKNNIGKTIEFLCSPDCPHVRLSRRCREDE